MGRARRAPEDAPCSIGAVPGSERLADTHEKDNPAFDRMHVARAQELATGRGVKVAVIDSGIVGGEGAVDPLRRRFTVPGVSRTPSCRATARSWPD